MKKEEILETENVDETHVSKENEVVKNRSILNKVWKVVKVILLGITSPIWFPWKVLFVRKKGRKYSEVPTNVKIFRILRSPFTKTLKFCVYLLIIGVEIIAIYKVSNSFVSYPIKKRNVQSYYLDYASQNSNKEEFETSFLYIDDWSFKAKENIYTFFDSKIVKKIFENANEDTVNHFLNRFNNDKEFRDNVESLVANSNALVSRTVKEYKDKIDAGSFQSTANMIVNTTSYVVDFNMLFDVMDTFLDYIPESSLNELYLIEPNMVDTFFDACFNYNNGQSLEEAFRVIDNDSNTEINVESEMIFN